jgi:flagellar motility protein MotE (MotC chaperone)
MMRLLQSSWLVSLAGCIVYLATTAVVLSSVKFEGPGPAEETPVSASDDPSWKFRNPEFDQWIEDLKNEKVALEARKLQLAEWETRLQAEHQELSAVTQRIAQIQMDFEKDVVRLREEETKNFKRQSKAMADMAPEAAAAMLLQMPDDDAARILSVMKDDQFALLLGTVSKLGQSQTKRAAAITERMRHLLPTSPVNGGATRIP